LNGTLGNGTVNAAGEGGAKIRKTVELSNNGERVRKKEKGKLPWLELVRRRLDQGEKKRSLTSE